ncbi:cytochrome P450 [Aspergillus multicolor]|uniref:cytochrome P450 n=1 Tax=Aspergillus multicolor TaxID=41759 RepID=UPI003CCD98BA
MRSLPMCLGTRCSAVWLSCELIVIIVLPADVAIAADGKIWMENKNELRPHLSNSRPTDVATTETHIQTFLGHLDNGGKPVEIYDLVDRLQLDIATDIFLGHSALTLEGEQQPFRDALNTLMAVNTVRMLIGPLALWSPDRLLAPVASRDMNRYMDKQIDKTLSLPRQELLEREGKLTLMETLALKTRDRKYIKNQLVAILLAGKDPVAITISWALYELACHPDVAQRLREEVVRVCGIERTPSADNLKEMLLLKYIIRETLRLYHPLGFNIREAQRNTTIPTGGGPRGDQPVTILKGERVAYSVIGLQRRKDLVGPDAGDWKPDRYFHWTPKTWEFIPFNHGPRICLGRVFGYFQMEYTLCRIFQRFERIELHEPRAQRIKVELNTKMAYPINCSFHRAA